MSNPTSNYSFVMPTSTDLVKDLPADFEVFGQAVDTQMKTNADAAIAKSIVDAKGDLIAATAADTVSRLAVGTDGLVLKADSTTSTGLAWGTAGGALTLSTIASGSINSGTALTINSLTAYDTMQLKIVGVTFGGGVSYMNFLLNGSTSAIYQAVIQTSYLTSSSPIGWSGFGDWTSIPVAPANPQDNTSTENYYILTLTNCKQSGYTIFNLQNSIVSYGTTRMTIVSGRFKSAAAISSITFNANGQTFNGSGTYELIGG